MPITTMPSHSPPAILVATDLDGTLIDHHSYQWHAASEALSLLKTHQIPVVINTSKTIGEVLSLQQALGIHDPFIVENGSAICIHAGDKRFDSAGLAQKDNLLIAVPGCERPAIINTLQQLRRDHGWQWRGYSDCTTADIMVLTGLDEAGALRSQSRHYSEPLLWQDSDAHFADFSRAIEAAGLRLLRGGRFIHVLGQTDKGEALQWLVARYRGVKPTVIALGDSHNDLEMLAVADHGVLVKSPAHDYPAFGHPHLIKTVEYGPAGWNKAIKQLLGTILDC